MCGICGITANDRPRVERMSEKIAHRGPDGSGIYEGNGITLGHRRLAIIDLSDVAAQPMKSNDGRYCIVFNGEIYNYQELRTLLEGTYEFKTHGDTEVLLAAYREWGSSMFSKLRGIFAFGIWDAQSEELVLARDRMGVKPLYYTIKDDVLAFASELSAFTDRSPTLDRESVSLFLSLMYVPSPRTMLEGVSKLPPGHVLRYKKGEYTLENFSVAVQPSASGLGLYDSIDQAVHRQLVSDRPVGAYLSGGFDSSIVVHHMAAHEAHVRTYSIGFEMPAGSENEGAKFNADARLAEKTAAFYGTEHTTVTISLDEIRSAIEVACSGVGEPVANATSVTQFLLSQKVRADGTVVVLGGDGGDELFGGYPRHRIIMGAYLFQKLPHLMQRGIGQLHPQLAKLATAFPVPMHMRLMADSEENIARFLSTSLPVTKTVTDFLTAQYANVQQPMHPLTAFMAVDRRTWLADECFIRSDYASMAHGIELRVPLVDIDVVACADSIPVWKKTLPHDGKRILKQTYQKYLPPHLYGQPKRGWLSPAAKWLRDPAIHAFTKEVFSSGYYSGLDSLFDWEKVHVMLDAHVNKKGYYLYPLWNILALQIWARKNGVIMDK